jgi:hypothetical protein
MRRRAPLSRQRLCESRSWLPETAIALPRGKLHVSHAVLSKADSGERRIDPVQLRDWCDAASTSPEAFTARHERTLRR